MSEGKIVMDGPPREIFLDVDTLRSAGLDVPETVALMHELNSDGFNLPLDALSVEECAQAIYMVLGCDFKPSKRRENG